MNKQIFTLMLSFIIVAAQAQIITFEDQLQEVDTFDNGQNGPGDFEIDNLVFPNEYDDDGDFWAGQWAMSSSTDNTTPNFMNLYGAIEGQGAEGSEVYAVAQEPFSGNPLHIKSKDVIMPQTVAITNTTYAYFTIRDGNQFSKAFGGPSGEDPDYFYITWTGYRDGSLQGSEDFYLADYRFANSSEDYIIDEWTTFDLSSLGEVDSITIEFYSSDTGQFGINTPLFFAIDNFSYESTSNVSSVISSQLKVYPNPVATELHWESEQPVKNIEIIDITGRTYPMQATGNVSNISHLSDGVYFLKWESNGKIGIKQFVKQ